MACNTIIYCLSEDKMKIKKESHRLSFFSFLSVILCVDLKETLRIIAGSADFGSAGANHDMAAVAALPNK